MGLKVHKVLGWGLTDLQTDRKGYTITDPRINPEGIAIKYDNERFSHESFMNFLESSEELRFEFLAAKTFEEKDKARREIPAWHVHHNSEYGIPEVLCLRPFGYRDWYRLDDSLDWIEETYLARRRQENRVNILKDAPYPYSGLFMDARNGEILSGNLAITYRRLYREFAEERNDSAKTIAALDYLARSMGFTDSNQAEEFIIPQIPDIIRAFVEWGEVFTDPNFIFQLRPMIYVYWL